ncbi:MAG: hypothetical protein ABI910_23555 [Gemmatimonadota bacterium]
MRCTLAVAVLSGGGGTMAVAVAQAPGASADGAHDFDWEIGVWRTDLRRLAKPLTGSTEWVEYHGTSTVRPVMGGKANLVELDVTGPAGRIEGLALRLYDPAARQWSLNYSNSGSGTLSAPVVGAFANGRGVFFGVDVANGQAVLARFIISEITKDSARFEQAFSGDGGVTWEVNWVAWDRRLVGSR